MTRAVKFFPYDLMLFSCFITGSFPYGFFRFPAIPGVPAIAGESPEKPVPTVLFRGPRKLQKGHVSGLQAILNSLSDKSGLLPNGHQRLSHLSAIYSLNSKPAKPYSRSSCRILRVYMAHISYPSSGAGWCARMACSTHSTCGLSPDTAIK